MMHPVGQRVADILAADLVTDFGVPKVQRELSDHFSWLVADIAEFKLQHGLLEIFTTFANADCPLGRYDFVVDDDSMRAKLGWSFCLTDGLIENGDFDWISDSAATWIMPAREMLGLGAIPEPDITTQFPNTAAVEEMVDSVLDQMGLSPDKQRGEDTLMWAVLFDGFILFIGSMSNGMKLTARCLSMDTFEMTPPKLALIGMQNSRYTARGVACSLLADSDEHRTFRLDITSTLAGLTIRPALIMASSFSVVDGAENLIPVVRSEPQAP